MPPASILQGILVAEPGSASFPPSTTSTCAPRRACVVRVGKAICEASPEHSWSQAHSSNTGYKTTPACCPEQWRVSQSLNCMIPSNTHTPRKETVAETHHSADDGQRLEEHGSPSTLPSSWQYCPQHRPVTLCDASQCPTFGSSTSFQWNCCLLVQ